jgi:hypothetical protein
MTKSLFGQTETTPNLVRNCRNAVDILDCTPCNVSLLLAHRDSFPL